MANKVRPLANIVRFEEISVVVPAIVELDATLKTAESIYQHSTNDADKWPQFVKHINKLTDFLKPIYMAIPPNISDIGLKDAIALTSMLKPIARYVIPFSTLNVIPEFGAYPNHPPFGASPVSQPMFKKIPPKKNTQ